MLKAILNSKFYQLFKNITYITLLFSDVPKQKLISSKTIKVKHSKSPGAALNVKDDASFGQGSVPIEGPEKLTVSGYRKSALPIPIPRVTLT